MRGLEWWFPRRGPSRSNAPGQGSAAGVVERFSALASAAHGDAVAEFVEKSAADEATMAGLELTVCSRRNMPEVQLSVLELGATWLPWVISPLH